MQRLHTIKLKRGKKDQRGVTAVEFAMISPVLFLVLIGTVESCLVMFAQHLLESAAYSASRLGKTGFTATSQTQQQTILDAVNNRVDPILDTNRLSMTTMAYRDYTRISQPEPFVDANGNGQRDNGENYVDVNGNGSWDTDQGTAGPGLGQEVVVYTISYPWELFTPMMAQLMGNTQGDIILTARVVVRNEPFGL